MPEEIHASLPLGGGLRLVGGPTPGCGKTAAMGKGLFLRVGDTTLSGGSAGFGLPLFRTPGGTVFPSSGKALVREPGVVVKTFAMDRTVRWFLGTRRCHGTVTRLGESLVRLYTGLPFLQRFFLGFRDGVLKALGAGPMMEEGNLVGRCAVEYRTAASTLQVKVEGCFCKGGGSIVVMNEGPAWAFTALRTGGRLRHGSEIPGWGSLPVNAVFEAPPESVAFSPMLPGEKLPRGWRIEGGREVGLGLDWAGFALSTAERRFSYGIRFSRLGSASGSAGKRKARSPGAPAASS